VSPAPKLELKLKLGQYQVEQGDVGIVIKVYKSEEGKLYAVKYKKDYKEITEIF